MSQKKRTAGEIPARKPAGRAAVYRQICAIVKTEQSPAIAIEKAIHDLKKYYKLNTLASNLSTGFVLFEDPRGAESAGKNVSRMMNRMMNKKEKRIKIAERNRIVGHAATPNDPFFSEQWAWTRLDAQAAWDRIDPNAAPVIVAIVDTGIADKHEDLRPYVQSPPSTVIGQTRDDDGHGTLLAGTIGAVKANQLGVAGAAAVQLLSVKFCSQQVVPSAGLGALAIIEAAQKGADVINLSWDCGFDSAALKYAIDYAGTQGAVVVVAAGNWGLDNDKYHNYPANHGEKKGHVITVMATDKDDDRASFSCFGSKSVFIAAPGVDILSTAPYNRHPDIHKSIRTGYRTYRGTSPAAAHVSGLVALILAQNPTWTPSRVKKHLRDSAEHLPTLKRRCVSEGMINYARAICGPLTIQSPQAGDTLQKNTTVNLTWDNAYRSSNCRTLKLTFIDNQGKESTLKKRIRNSGSVKVQMPNQTVSRARLRLSSEQANFYADSGVFSLTP